MTEAARIWVAPVTGIEHRQPDDRLCRCGDDHRPDLDARELLAALPVGERIRVRVRHTGAEDDAVVREHHGTHIMAARRHLPADDNPARAQVRALMVVSGAAVAAGLLQVERGWAEEQITERHEAAS